VLANDGEGIFQYSYKAGWRNIKEVLTGGGHFKFAAVLIWKLVERIVDEDAFYAVERR